MMATDILKIDASQAIEGMHSDSQKRLRQLYVNHLVDETSREAESAVEAEVHVDEGPQRQRVPQLQHNIEASRAWERGPNFCSVRAKNMAWAASLYSVMFGT